MRHHYYWNTEMPDSSTLDLTVDPAKFFATLLSPKDRFSWCEVNRDYKTRGVNTGSTVSFDSVYVFNNKKIGYAIYDQFDDNADINRIYNNKVVQNCYALLQFCIRTFLLSVRPYPLVAQSPRQTKRTQPQPIRNFQSDSQKREPMTICHENEEVYTSDFHTV